MSELQRVSNGGGGKSGECDGWENVVPSKVGKSSHRENGRKCGAKDGDDEQIPKHGGGKTVAPLIQRGVRSLN